MRRKGVTDAQKDQKAGQRDKQTYGNEKVYKGDGTFDGHHKDPIADYPEKMTDPRNIKLVDQKVHSRYHKIKRQKAKF